MNRILKRIVKKQPKSLPCNRYTPIFLFLLICHHPTLEMILLLPLPLQCPFHVKEKERKKKKKKPIKCCRL